MLNQALWVGQRHKVTIWKSYGMQVVYSATLSTFPAAGSFGGRTLCSTRGSLSLQSAASQRPVWGRAWSAASPAMIMAPGAAAAFAASLCWCVQTAAER